MMTDHFWLRFIKSYLPNLQICQKWALLLLALCFAHYSTCDCQGMNVGVNELVELLRVTYTTLYQNPPRMLLAYSHPHTNILEQWRCFTLTYFLDTRFTLVLEHAYLLGIPFSPLCLATMSASTWAYMMFGVYNSIQTSPGHCNQLWDAQCFLT